MRPFGYHIEGGQVLGSALQATAQVGFTSAQIFLGNPRMMDFKRPSSVQIELFKTVKRDFGMKVYVHAPYVLHAFAKPENKIKNDQYVTKAVEFATELDCDGYVLHMGGTKWYSEDQYFVLALELFDNLPTGAHCPILFENCASGNSMSGDLASIVDLISKLQANQCTVGLCLDTLHAWAYGYDYTKPEGFAKITDWSVVSKLQLIHLNSGPEEVLCGSKYDRHAGLMEGTIPIQFFTNFLKAIPGIPTIVERETESTVLADYSYVKSIDSEHELLNQDAKVV